MTVMPLSIDYTIAPYLMFSNHEFHINFDQGKFYKDWAVQDCYISEPRPTKNCLMGLHGGIVILEKYIHLFRESLEPFAQLLPVEVEENGLGYLTNSCIIDNDCLDLSQTLFMASGDRYRWSELTKELKKIASPFPLNMYFSKDKIKYPIFNLYYSGRVIGPFATKGIFPEEQEFATLVDKYNIKGLVDHHYPVV